MKTSEMCFWKQKASHRVVYPLHGKLGSCFSKIETNVFANAAGIDAAQLEPGSLEGLEGLAIIWGMQCQSQTKAVGFKNRSCNSYMVGGTWSGVQATMLDKTGNFLGSIHAIFWYKNSSDLLFRLNLLFFKLTGILQHLVPMSPVLFGWKQAVAIYLLMISELYCH